MEHNPLWSNTPAIMSHHYWHNIKRFQLPVDTYSNWAMFIPENGSFAFRIADEAGQSGFGTMVLCPPHIPFHRETIEPFTFHFMKFHLDGTNGAFHTNDQSLTHGLRVIGDQERLSSNLRILRKLVERTDQLAMQWKSTIVRDMLLLADNHLHSELHVSLRATDNPELLAILERLQTLASTPFSMERVAAEFGLTAVQLTRKFKKTFSINPSEFVTSLRMDRIKSLLLESDYTLQEIAEQCGYDNGYYLSRIFSSRVGVSPSVYRKKNKV